MTSPPQPDAPLPPADAPRHIPVDVEHLGVRLMMPLLALGGLVGGFFLGRAISQAIDPSIAGACVGLPVGIVLAVLLVQVGERFIKPRWRSGRHLELDRQGLTLVDVRGRQQEQQRFLWEPSLHAAGWYFEVQTGRSRVPKGWYCVALRLWQAETLATLYTFLDPDDVSQYFDHFNERFTRLVPEKKSGLGRLSSTSPSRAAQQSARYKKYLDYEQTRWLDGAEISVEALAEIAHLTGEHGHFQPTA